MVEAFILRAKQAYLRAKQTCLRAKQTFFVVALMVGLSACSVVGSITEEGLPGSVIKFDKATGAEFVSGSNQYEHTLLRDYRINSSVGGMIKEIQSTTPRGYKVYSSVQGALLYTQENQ